MIDCWLQKENFHLHRQGHRSRLIHPSAAVGVKPRIAPGPPTAPKAHLDPIGESKYEDDADVQAEDGLNMDEPDASEKADALSEAVVSQQDPYGKVDLGGPGCGCRLRMSVVSCLFSAWSDTRSAASHWVAARNRDLWSLRDGEAALCEWLEQPSGAAFAEDLRVALSSAQHPDCHPHLSSTSVAFQPSELEAFGYSALVVVLHWIFLLELLPLGGGDAPVCGADRAWRFGCVPPCLACASTCTTAVFPSDDCVLFCALLGEEGAPQAPFRVLWERQKRVHVCPCVKGAPFGLSDLRLAVEHPDSLLSFHLEAGSGACMLQVRDRLAALVRTAPSWFVLRGPADDGLVLLVAWGTVVTVTQSGLCVALHGSHEANDVVKELAAGVHTFFHTTMPASVLGARAAEISPGAGVAQVLAGRHWLHVWQCGCGTACLDGISTQLGVCLQPVLASIEEGPTEGLRASLLVAAV